MADDNIIYNGYLDGTAIGGNSDPIRNLNWVHIMWADIQFDASTKGLPSFKDAPTWTSQSDNISEFSARTIVGKSEGLEVIEVTVETDPIKVYQGLLAFYGRNVCADLLLTWANPGGTYKAAFQENHNEFYPTTFGAQEPEEEPDKIEELTIVVPRCTMTGLAPAGGDNNGISNTTVKFQPEGGPVENLPYVVKTKFYDKIHNKWDYEAAMSWSKYWDGSNPYLPSTT